MSRGAVESLPLRMRSRFFCKMCQDNLNSQNQCAGIHVSIPSLLSSSSSRALRLRVAHAKRAPAASPPAFSPMLFEGFSRSTSLPEKLQVLVTILVHGLHNYCMFGKKYEVSIFVFCCAMDTCLNKPAMTLSPFLWRRSTSRTSPDDDELQTSLRTLSMLGLGCAHGSCRPGRLSSSRRVDNVRLVFV